MRARIALLLALLVGALAGVPAVAAACPRTSLPDVEDEVMCTVCGTPLNISESPQAEDERNFIRERVAACDTKSEIKDKLVGQYGAEVLALPKDRGFNRAVYIVPIAVVAAALAVLAYAIPRWRRNRGRDGGGPDAPEIAPSDARRLDDDLAGYDV